MNIRQNKKENDLIVEAYQQINEWGGDLDPANNPLDALKYRIAEMEGQNPRVTARYAREVVDQILHMGKAVSAEEVEAVLRAQKAHEKSGDPRTGKWDYAPLFNDELVQYIMTPFEDKHDDGSERFRSSWKSDNQPANINMRGRAASEGEGKPDEQAEWNSKQATGDPMSMY